MLSPRFRKTNGFIYMLCKGRVRWARPFVFRAMLCSVDGARIGRKRRTSSLSLPKMHIDEIEDSVHDSSVFMAGSP